MWTVGQTVYWALAQDIFVRGTITTKCVRTDRNGTKNYYSADFVGLYGVEGVCEKLESFFFSTIEEVIAALDNQESYFADDV